LSIRQLPSEIVKVSFAAVIVGPHDDDLTLGFLNSGGLAVSTRFMFGFAGNRCKANSGRQNQYAKNANAQRCGPKLTPPEGAIPPLASGGHMIWSMLRHADKRYPLISPNKVALQHTSPEQLRIPL
jgi:hypothetical protein